MERESSLQQGKQWPERTKLWIRDGMDSLSGLWMFSTRGFFLIPESQIGFLDSLPSHGATGRTRLLAASPTLMAYRYRDCLLLYLDSAVLILRPHSSLIYPWSPGSSGKQSLLFTVLSSFCLQHFSPLSFRFCPSPVASRGSCSTDLMGSFLGGDQPPPRRTPFSKGISSDSQKAHTRFFCWVIHSS